MRHPRVSVIDGLMIKNESFGFFSDMYVICSHIYSSFSYVSNMADISSLYAFVLTSVVRKKILVCLKGGPLRPAEISQMTGIKQPNVSVALRDLVKQGLVRCLTPDKPAWRVFELLDVAEDVLSLLDARSRHILSESGRATRVVAETPHKYPVTKKK